MKELEGKNVTLSNAYSLDVPIALKKFSSNLEGLSNHEVKNRLDEFGPNKLAEAKPDSLLIIFLSQFKSPLIYALFGAAAIVFLTGNKSDSLVIVAVLLFNAFVGAFQEGKAQNTLLALKNFTKTSASVLRNGEEIRIHDADIVPGDILILREGDKISADARVIFSKSLKVDESVMTGESEYKLKTEFLLENKEIPLADQSNMVLKGTNVVSGNGRALVVATGMQTVLGKISEKLAVIDTEIPLKTNIRNLSKMIVYAVLGIVSIIFLAGMALGIPTNNLFQTVVALSVSIIPEGLPIVITLVLATGVWRMSKRNVLVKKLQAVEALGQAKVIAVDKTGTITKNELSVQRVYLFGKYYDVMGSGYEPTGKIIFEKKSINGVDQPELKYFGRIAVLCSNAQLIYDSRKKAWKISGDPTEAAMISFSKKVGLSKNEVDEYTRIDEVPFDYKSRLHAVLVKSIEKNQIIVSGSPENILSLCNADDAVKKELEKVFFEMSSDGLRVIAFAVKDSAEEKINESDLSSLSFVGFLGMRDTLRAEVIEAAALAKSAGVKVVMITGDNKVTAEAIARKAGIFKDGDQILTGEEMDNMTDTELAKKINSISVYARINPEAKLRIIQIFRNKKKVIAMTGDGVNDALSLAAADIGVSMGKIGTDVAKESADIIILDDNFGSLVAGIEEGRNIYKTIKKVILYLFSTNLGELFTIVGAMILGMPLPILAVQILWLNLVTDGFLDVSLAMEPKEDSILKYKPKAEKWLIDRKMLKRMFLMALPMMVGTLALFNLYYKDDINKAWTVSLTTLAAFQWFNAWNCRSEDKSIFKMNFFSNIYLVFATVIIVLLHLLALYMPLMQKIFHTTPLGIVEWIYIILTASSILVIEELRKMLSRK